MPIPRRTFNPAKSSRYGIPTFAPNILIKYSPKWSFTRLFSFPFPGSHFRPQMTTLVLSIDGGCHPNDRSDPSSTAAFAVHFGPNNPDNCAALLPKTEPQTSNRAELHAAIMALGIVARKKRAGELEIVREVIVMTDSEYVARSMSLWVWKWERNGWRTKEGGEVENQDLIVVLHGLGKGLEREGVNVRFWRVGREWNGEADGMVRAVLA